MFAGQVIPPPPDQRIFFATRTTVRNYEASGRQATKGLEVGGIAGRV